MPPAENETVSSIESSIRRATLFQLSVFSIYLSIIIIAGYIFLDKNLIQKILNLPPGLIIAMLALTAVNGAIRTWRWIFVSLQLQLSVPVRENILYFVAGFSMLSTPAKIGELIRLWFLKKTHKISYSRSLPLLLFDRISDMWGVTLLLFLTFYGFDQFHEHIVYAAIVFFIFSIPIFFPLQLRKLFNFNLTGLFQRPVEFLRDILSILGELKSWKVISVVLIPTAVGWIVECFGFYLLLNEFDVNISIQKVLFIYMFSLTIGALSMLPGGLGSAEATMILLLTGLGVELQIAISATVIARLVTLWFATGVGFVVLPFAVRKLYYNDV